MTKVAILSSLPHSFDDVEASRDKPHRDYVRSNLSGYFQAPEKLWVRVSEYLGSEANAVFDFCEQNDIKVYKNAGLAELTQACSCSKIVIVLSHWKGPWVALYPPDILASVEELATPVQACIEQGFLLPSVLDDFSPARSADKLKDILASGLNEAIKNWKDLNVLYSRLSAEGNEMIISNAYGLNFSREIINGIFGDKTLIPGARIEMADGLWGPETISQCIPEGWNGICDFVCCTSEYLASELSTTHPYATFRSDSRLLQPDTTFKVLDCVVKELLKRPSDDIDYMSALYSCSQKMGDIA